MGKGERKYGDRKDVISPLMATQDFLEGVGGTRKGIELGKSGEMEFSVITVMGLAGTVLGSVRRVTEQRTAERLTEVMGRHVLHNRR